MNEKQFYNNNEVEINMIDLFWSVARQWRKIVIAMLVLGALLGGRAFLKEFRNYRDPDKRLEATQAYNKALKNYEKKKENMEKELENLSRLQAQLDNIKEHGIYLKIDPYNVYRIDITYYIDSNYEIMPGTVYQNPNTTTALLKSYQSVLAKINLEKLVDDIGEDVIVDVPVAAFSKDDICSFTSDDTEGFLYVKITADTQERAERIYNEVVKTMDSQKKTLTKVVGAHQVSIVAEVKGYTVDYSMENKQAEFSRNYYQKNLETIETKTDDLAALEAPKSELINKKRVVMSGIKGGTIGAIGGILLVGAYYAISNIFVNRLMNTNELRTRYHLPVLGSIKLSDAKDCQIDTFISEKLGVDKRSSAEDSSKLIISNAKRYFKDISKLLVVGSAGSNAVEKVRDSLAAELPNVEVLACGDINTNPEAIDALSDGATIICVEEWQKSNHLNIACELEKLTVGGNNDIGFVVVC